MILVVGFDGATWDVARPLIERGEMRVLAGICRSGASGVLSSTVPPVTFPAWSTFMTGMNPGKHGIFDFTVRRFGTYGLRFVSAADRREATLWGRISRAGGRVGVIGVPATYPPEKVNGFLVSGFDSPLSSGITASFVYPRSLYHELKAEVGEYRVTDFQELRIGKRWHDKAFRRICDTMEIKLAWALHMLRRGPWDFFMVLFGESDTVSHHFWMFHDPASPRHDPVGAARFGEAIRSVYRRLDVALGRLVAESPKGATVIVMSDHGFGGAGMTALHLNAWLEAHGYLRFCGGREELARRALHLARRRILPWFPRRIQEWMVRAGGGRGAGEAEARARFGGIDWRRTVAFSEELNYAPGVWLHVAGRDPLGCVSASEYEGVRTKLIGDLQGWRNPYTGEPIVRRAWRREELYWGPHVELAPDLVLELDLDAGYSYCCLPTPGSHWPAVTKLPAKIRAGCKGMGMNGSHRREGMIAAAGPSIRPGASISAGLEDVAPTILRLMGLSVPAEMDGRVIAAAIEPRAAEKRAVVAGAGSLPPAETGSLEEREAAEIRGRLASLGYLG